ncbi:MAG: phosphopyruvate hydratase [Myxococcota bacterium]
MTDPTIEAVRGRRVWDSRGRPTVEAEVGLAGGARGRAIAPAGASRGRGEAEERRDGGARFGGYDVQGAVAGVSGEIDAALRGMDARDQEAVDRRLVALDGTPDRSRLGANALVAVSMATLRAAAAAQGEPVWRWLAQGRSVRLPLPEVQIFGGGAHAGARIDLQDLMVLPIAALSLCEALEVVAEVYAAAGDCQRSLGRACGVADEGGWWPEFDSNEEALEATVKAIEAAGLAPGRDVAISLDLAASQLRTPEGRYRLALEARELDLDAWIERLCGWVDRYPIAALEDPCGEDDPDGMRRVTGALGSRVQVIGDDLLVTDAARIREAARTGACNAALIKPDQVGTLSEARSALETAREQGLATLISARSGDSEDVTLAHLAVGWDAGQIKVGSFARSERLAKWNELIRIEEALGSEARFAGASVLPEPWRRAATRAAR